MHPSNLLVVIPARYGSSRLPGKPLKMLGNQTLIQRTFATAQAAKMLLPPQLQKKVDIVVATDDQRIMDHLNDHKIPVEITSKACRNGTERLIACYRKLNRTGGALNLQGDAPLIPPKLIAELIHLLLAETEEIQTILTSAHTLTWSALDQLRTHKQDSPFSGTCVTSSSTSQALWFSKNIIPAIRHEDTLRTQSTLSPVLKHLGIYGFKDHAIKKLESLPISHYESIEELEQLRWIEAGMHIYLHKTKLKSATESLGIDSPKDLKIAQQWLLQESSF